MGSNKYIYLPTILAIIVIVVISFISQRERNNKNANVMQVEKKLDEIKNDSRLMENNLISERRLRNNVIMHLQPNMHNIHPGAANIVADSSISRASLNTSDQIVKINEKLAEVGGLVNNLKENSPSADFLPKLIISVIVLIGSFLIILIKSVPDTYKKIANSVITAMIGFWLGIKI